MYMKQIKAFVSRLNDTFNNPSFYKQSITEPREKAMSLLFWVNVLAASVFAVTVLINVIPSMIDFSKGDYVRSTYPDGLQIDIKDSTVSINEAVKLREVPAYKASVSRFTGYATEKRIATKKEALVATLTEAGVTMLDTPQVAQYNPPLSFPFTRRNEIIVVIE